MSTTGTSYYLARHAGSPNSLKTQQILLGEGGAACEAQFGDLHGKCFLKQTSGIGGYWPLGGGPPGAPHPEETASFALPIALCKLRHFR